MGIYNQVVMYRTDGGQVMALSDMTTTHLMNAINHHNVQIKTIEFIQETIELNETGVARMQQRKEALATTVTALSCELVRRDPAEDPEVVGDNLEFVRVGFMDPEDY